MNSQKRLPGETDAAYLTRLNQIKAKVVTTAHAVQQGLSKGVPVDHLLKTPKKPVDPIKEKIKAAKKDISIAKSYLTETKTILKQQAKLGSL